MTPSRILDSRSRDQDWLRNKPRVFFACGSMLGKNLPGNEASIDMSVGWPRVIKYMHFGLHHSQQGAKNGRALALLLAVFSVLCTVVLRTVQVIY